MKSNNPMRLLLAVAMSTALASASFVSQAQPGSDVSTEHKEEAKAHKQKKHEEKYDKMAHQQQKRLSQEQQQKRIHQQKKRLTKYSQRIAEQQAIAQRNAQQLEQQKRLAFSRYQYAYNEKLRRQQARLENDRHDYDNDPFYYTPSTYRYRRGEKYYETNEYGAERLRKASNIGYQQGVQAGRADKQDSWRFDYQESFAYQDANYGFDGRYVEQEDYNHYFREGFQRGYEDGYYDRRNYGANTDSSDSLLGTVMNMILSLQPLQ